MDTTQETTLTQDTPSMENAAAEVAAEATDRELLERVERAAAQRAAEEQVAASAAEAERRARAEAADRERRERAAEGIESTLAEGLQAVATLVECAETWHRNVAKLREVRDEFSRTLAPFASANKHQAVAMLADLASDYELRTLMEEPERKRLDMETPVLVTAERRADRLAGLVREILGVPTSNAKGVAP